MNAIIGLTYLLQKEIKTPKQHGQLLKVNDAAQHLMGIINDILDLSKIEAGRLTLELIPFNLLDALNELTMVFSEQAQWKDITLKMEIDPELPYSVEGDSVRLRQILINLVGNALKFTEQGVITIKASNVELASEHVIIKFEVSDTGIGISPEALPHIFDRFAQADGSTTRRFGGTGLGLTISQQLTELMGGVIGVESTAGVGSTFWFTVHMARYSGILPESTYVLIENDLPAAPRAAAKILVVEDTRVNSEVCCELLKYMGHTSIVASNGLDALELLLTDRFDLVLMDCQMPVMDGYEATQKYRNWEVSHGDRRLAIIALTGNAMEPDRQLCLDAGMDDYLKKPFNLIQLKDILAKWLPDLTQNNVSDNSQAINSTLNISTIADSMLLERAPLEAIKELRRPGSPDILARVISVYETDSPRLIISMRNSLQQNNTDEIIRAVHSLKTSSGMLGARLLADHCHALEKTLREGGDLMQAKAFIDKIEIMLQSATILLRSEIQGESF
ncbi:MAG: ATP-binding protein, partial [Desulfuromonadales bacterium]